MPRRSASGSRKNVYLLWLGLGLAAILVVVGIVIAIVMSGNESDNTGTGTGGSGGSGDSDDSVDSIDSAVVPGLPACLSGGYGGSSAGDYGYELDTGNSLTVTTNAQGFTLFNDQPVITPLQCAALCEVTPNCWAYMFSFENDNQSYPVCELKSKFIDEYSVSKFQSSASEKNLHKTGELCDAPEIFYARDSANNNQLADNYYIQYGKLGQHSKSSFKNYHDDIVTFGLLDDNAGTEDITVRENPIYRDQAIRKCEQYCNDEPGNACVGFELDMLQGNYNGSPFSYSNQWRCALMQEGGIGLSIHRNDTNDRNSCDWKTDASSSFPSDLGDCTVVGIRNNKVRTG